MTTEPRAFALIPASQVYLRRGDHVLLQQRVNTGYMPRANGVSMGSGRRRLGLATLGSWNPRRMQTWPGATWKRCHRGCRPMRSRYWPAGGTRRSRRPAPSASSTTPSSSARADRRREQPLRPSPCNRRNARRRGRRRPVGDRQLGFSAWRWFTPAPLLEVGPSPDHGAWVRCRGQVRQTSVDGVSGCLSGRLCWSPSRRLRSAPIGSGRDLVHAVGSVCRRPRRCMRAGSWCATSRPRGEETMKRT